MKAILEKPAFINSLYCFITIALFVFVVSIDPIFFPDSDDYINMSINRSIGYPSFVAIHQLLFGNGFASALIYSQFFLIIASSLFFLKCLKSALGLNKWYLFIVFLIILTPLVYEFRLANAVLSESLAYPLYLFTIGNLLLGVIRQQRKNVYFTLLLLYLLICVRGQFLFMIPVVGIAILFFDGRFSLKKDKVILLIATLFVFTGSITTDVLFHTFRHGHVTTTPWTGIQISALPFFTADENAAQTLETQQQKDYFRFVYQQLSDHRLLANQLPSDINKTDFYYSNYVPITNGIIKESGEQFFKGNFSADERTILNDKMSASITYPLIKNHFANWFLMYINIINKGFGSMKIMLLFLILLFISAGMFYRTQSNYAKSLIFFCLLLFGNIILVALAEPANSRYTFYNNWIIITVFLFLFQKSFQKQHDA